MRLSSSGCFPIELKRKSLNVRGACWTGAVWGSDAPLAGGWEGSRCCEGRPNIDSGMALDEMGVGGRDAATAGSNVALPENLAKPLDNDRHSEKVGSASRHASTRKK
jgi:hypothetical protein